MSVCDRDCKEGYYCYNHDCVKLFDVEIIKVEPLADSLIVELKYFIKGMADINSDVIIDFWVENADKKIKLGRDTIYLGSFEEKTKITTLNLPYDILEGTYDLYVQVTYENYQAGSFRKINIRLPEEELEIPVREHNISTGLVAKASPIRVSVDLFWPIILSLVVLLVVLYFKFKENKLSYMLMLFEKGREIKNRIKSFTDLGNPNCLNSLIGKNVYTDDGDHLGEVQEAIIVGNKIDSLIIRLDKDLVEERKTKSKGIIADYGIVVNVGEIVIVSKYVLDDLV